MSRITEFLGPAMTTTIGHALVGLIILVAGVFIVSLLVRLVSRLLSRAEFLKRVNADGTVTDLASPIASLIKAVLTVFVVMAVLQHFGLTDVLAPLREMVTQFMTAIPHIVGAGVIIPLRLISGAIMFFSMLAAATAAVNVLGIDIISTVFAGVLQFGGGLLVGAVILVVGNFLGSIAHQKLSASGSSGLANIARIAILGLVLAMGLRSMGLADNIVNMAFGFTIGSVAVAAALAFGLGGVDAAKSIADQWASRAKGSSD